MDECEQNISSAMWLADFAPMAVPTILSISHGESYQGLSKIIHHTDFGSSSGYYVYFTYCDGETYVDLEISSIWGGADNPEMRRCNIGNVGKYSKPWDGIPKTDLASDIQASLDKADSAIQSVKTINGQSIVGSGDIEIKGGTDVNLNDYYTKSEIDDKGYLYKVILTQAQYNELVEYDPQALYVISDATEDSQNNFVTESQLNDRGFLTSSDRVEIEDMFSAYEKALSSLEATITSLQAKIAELEAKLDDTLTI